MKSDRGRRAERGERRERCRAGMREIAEWHGRSHGREVTRVETGRLRLRDSRAASVPCGDRRGRDRIFHRASIAFSEFDLAVGMRKTKRCRWRCRVLRAHSTHSHIHDTSLIKSREHITTPHTVTSRFHGRARATHTSQSPAPRQHVDRATTTRAPWTAQQNAPESLMDTQHTAGRHNTSLTHAQRTQRHDKDAEILRQNR